MDTAAFNFHLPPQLIAQTPAPSRDASRLLVLHRNPQRIEHRRFRDVKDYLQSGDLLVLNNSRVIPARLRAINPQTGGRFELLLLEQNAVNDWWCLLNPGRKARSGLHIELTDSQGRTTGIHAEALERHASGQRRIAFSGTRDVAEQLTVLGEVPLPHYIQRTHGPTDEDRNRYQTVFAQPSGSVAAPTAGLHFTPDLLNELQEAGVELCFLTLHVGPGTFVPVKTATPGEHVMHEERYDLSEQAARQINEARAAARRIVAVGTTSVRVLESVAANHNGRLVAGSGRTRLFIFPPHQFQVTGALLTNFHLPRSTLLMLVSAFAAPGETRGVNMILSAYQQAIQENYRFFSYGDAMLLT